MGVPTRKTHSSTVMAEPPVYADADFNSNDGMLTTVWGPGIWHYLHTMSFNYPVSPTPEDKQHYRDFVLQLQYVLPCGKCRKNLRKNFKRLPLTMDVMESRDTFSLYIYKLHEVVNKMLDKKSGLSYADVRERYEHFRARCVQPLDKLKSSVGTAAISDKRTRKYRGNAGAKRIKNTKHKRRTEKGCTEPLYGVKAKCVLSFVPQTDPTQPLQIDGRCVKRRSVEQSTFES